MSERKEGSSNSKRLVLVCIEADFCNQTSSRPTALAAGQKLDHSLNSIIEIMIAIISVVGCSEIENGWFVVAT